MKLRFAALILGSALLVVSFQNCGQQGSVSTVASSLQKSDGDPLVVDVVDEIENQDGLNQIQIIDDKKKNHTLEELLDSYACDNNDKKVLICHYPPGNPSARHEICISRNALQAHIDHHHSDGSADHVDHMGYCDQDPQED